LKAIAGATRAFRAHGRAHTAGGEGHVGRTALGVAFISILNSGLLNLGLTDAHYQLYKGGTLLLVLSVQIWLRRLVAERARLEREQAVGQDVLTA